MCTERINHTLIRVEEKKRKAVFRNSGRADHDVSKIDGCLVTSGARADYLVRKINSTSVLVELKGSDVKHACEQLLASVEHAAVKPLLQARVGFLVICRKYPRFDTFVMKAKQACAKKYKAGFHVVVDQGVFDIDRVAAIDGPN